MLPVLLHFGRQHLRRIDVGLEIRLRGKPPRRRQRLLVVGALEFVLGRVLGALDERRMQINQVLDAQAGVDEGFHLFHAEAIEIPPHTIAVVGHLIHHLAVGLREPIVVLEEIGVAVDVGHHQLLIRHGVGAHQVRVAGIIVDHQLVDFLQPVLVAFGKLLVLHAEAPMRVARGESAVGGNFVKLIVVHHFENRGIKIQTIAARVIFHLALDVGQVARQRIEMCYGSHG